MLNKTYNICVLFFVPPFGLRQRQVSFIVHSNFIYIKVHEETAEARSHWALFHSHTLLKKQKTKQYILFEVFEI